ncbi:lymphocyte activation gene 3 protein [Parambassis ranga]|uniref:Lymphocyte activation gene 3 protein n=1 Tax=Parambassis ranga TaxID=210632 RepID=A0A6P7JTI8_9TELE|nr:lymphocyte activation gene 3 protein [Parambassis ranga]
MMLQCFLFGVISFIMTGARCEVAEVLAEAGSQAVLPCKCSILSTVSPAITWIKASTGTVWRKERNGLQFWGSSWLQTGSRVRCPHSQFERGDYSLQINSVRDEDGGLYTCRVDCGKQQVTDTFVRLRIIKVSVSPAVAIWGSSVSVTCSVTPWRTGASVQWKLNDSPFVSLTGTTKSEGQSVVKEKATDRLAGTWTCVVGYAGKEGRASAALSVQGIIQPSTDNTQVYAAVGSAVTLPCVFSSGLTPVNVVWERLTAESLLKSTPDHLPPSFSPSSAHPPMDKSVSSKEVGFEDAGRYRCAGSVDKQMLTRSMQLIIAKIVPSKKRDSVVLTCQLSDTSGVTKYDWVQVTYDLNGTESAVLVQEGMTLSISKVSEQSRGEWMCRFYGKQGILGNVTYQVHSMAGLSGQKSTDHSRNTATIAGLSFLLLLLLLILAQMYKNHQRRKRILPYPALETIVHTISNEREEREKHRVKK